MHPILFQIGPFTLYTYGLFVAIGFTIAIIVAQHEAKRLGENPKHMYDLCIYEVIAALIGSRLLYIYMFWKSFKHNLLGIFKIWEGGLVFYGGLMAALLVGAVYVRLKKIGLPVAVDILAPAVAIGHSMGRIGCFMAGCCYGTECDLPWAVTFRNPVSLAPAGMSLHPTQLYSSLVLLVIFLMLMFYRKHKPFNGAVGLLYLILYSTARFLLEFFRGDDRGHLVGAGISITQGLSVIICVVAIGTYLYTYFHTKTN